MSFGLLTTAGLLFIAGIPIETGLLASPWEAGEASLAVALLGGAGMFGWQYRKVQSGLQDLAIDESAWIVKLPLTYQRRKPLIVPFSEISGVKLDPSPHRNKYGTRYTYMVTIDLKDGTSQKLTDLNQSRANSPGAWLGEKFGFKISTKDLDAFPDPDWYEDASVSP
jgi:hypothetical protein